MITSIREMSRYFFEILTAKTGQMYCFNTKVFLKYNYKNSYLHTGRFLGGRERHIEPPRKSRWPLTAMSPGQKIRIIRLKRAFLRQRKGKALLEISLLRADAEPQQVTDGLSVSTAVHRRSLSSVGAIRRCRSAEAASARVPMLTRDATLPRRSLSMETETLAAQIDNCPSHHDELHSDRCR